MMARAGGERDPKSSLRRRAEARLRRQQAPAQGDTTAARRVVHELQVHQIELQMQNQELRDVQAVLTATRDRYASLFDLAPVAYLLLHETGTILEANDAACALFARARHRLRGRALAALVAQDDRAAVARHLLEAAAEPARTRPLRVALEGLPVRVARLETVRDVRKSDGGCNYRVTLIDVTDQAMFETRLRAERAALERSQAALREVTRRLVVAEEDERRRIAADLHDDIGQRLHAAQIDLEMLSRHLSGRAKWAAEVATVRQHLEEVVRDLETLARNLHPKIVEDLGLRVALKAHAEDLGHQAGMAVRFRERAVPDVVPASVATCLYRVAQEALRNVHRHARANAATVTLARVRRALGLCVADAGRGFDQEKAHLSHGLGLVTMNERVSALGGHFRVRANPGDGTHVHAWVPLQ